MTTLQAGGYSDFKVKVVLNVPFNATGTYLLDNLRFVAGQAGGCGDFVEGNILGTWTSGGDAATTTLSVLTSGAVRGSQALRAVTNAPFDFFVRYNAPTPINASGANELRVAVRSLNTTPGGWQITGPVLVAEDTNGARIQFEPRRQMLGVDGNLWTVASAPIAGSPSWITTGGPVNWSSIRAIEIHADTFDDGFTLDVDAVSFERTGTTGVHHPCGTTASESIYCDGQLGWGGTASCSSARPGSRCRQRLRAAERRHVDGVDEAVSKAAGARWPPHPRDRREPVLVIDS